MSNVAIVRRICVLLLLVAMMLSGLTVLTASAVAGGPGATQEPTGPSTSLPTTGTPSPTREEPIPLDVAVMKAEPSLRDSILAGTKDDVEVLVFSTDVPALARVMEKYSHEGLLGPNAEKSDFPWRTFG